MAAKQEIELFISDDGQLKVHIKGLKGPGCLKILDSITKEVGTLQKKQVSSEYYEKPEILDSSKTNVKKK
ncbi:MAG: DUF2997 domain-containing protein [Candidatus Omnitrophota bacterium]|jgi:hypothetical protein